MVPEQILVLPDIVPGWTGAVPLIIITFIVLAMDESQTFLAITEITPPVAPAIAVIELPVEVPVQPLGNFHVYQVAPEIGVMLYVFDEPEQTFKFPIIVSGREGTMPLQTILFCFLKRITDVNGLRTMFPETGMPLASM